MDTYRERHREEFKEKVREQVKNLLIIRDKLRSKIVNNRIEFRDLRDIAEEINKCGKQVKYPTHYGEPEQNFGEAWASEFTDEERLLLRLAWASKGYVEHPNSYDEYGIVTLYDNRTKKLSRESPGFGKWEISRELYLEVICCQFLGTAFRITISYDNGIMVREQNYTSSKSKICGMEDDCNFKMYDLKYLSTFWECLERLEVSENDLETRGEDE